MKKFFLSLLMATALTVTGCGTGAEPANGTAANGTVATSANESAGGDTETSAAPTNAAPDTAAPTDAAAETPLPLPDTSGKSGSLTIAVVGEYNDYLKAAIESYKVVNPNASIELSEYSWDTVQYMQSISTAVMSGGGEDIFNVSDITWQKLADKDKLVNLDEYISFTDDEFFMSILDAYLYKGKRYTLPAAFQFKAFGFADAYLGIEPAADLNMDSLLAMAERYPEKKLFFSVESRDAMSLATELLLPLTLNEFIDIENKKADVNNDKFITFLNNAKTLSEKIALTTNEDILLRQYDVWKPDGCTWILEYTADSEGISSMGTGGAMDYSDFFLFTNNEGEGCFESLGGLTPMPAINVNSEHRELAADFIKHLFTPEMQTEPSLMFSPVNRKAQSILGAENLEKYEGAEGFDYAKNSEIFDRLVSRLTFAKSNDTTINDFFYKEMESFFGGQQTAEQAASNLQSKLTMYLNE